jgi:hypothetical protein
MRVFPQELYSVTDSGHSCLAQHRAVWGSSLGFAAFILNIGPLKFKGSAPSEPLQHHRFNENGKWPVSFSSPRRYRRTCIGPV